MVTLVEIYGIIDKARKENKLKKENYWIYFSHNGTDVAVSSEYKKRKNYVGYFVEDDDRLYSIYNVAQHKILKNGK